METENDSKMAFLDASVSREPDGHLTTSVYRKPTHTDQYFAYDSHHPKLVKRGIVECLYDRAKRLVTKPSVISEEKKRLSSVLVSNGCPSSFLHFHLHFNFSPLSGIVIRFDNLVTSQHGGHFKNRGIPYSLRFIRYLFDVKCYWKYGTAREIYTQIGYVFQLCR